MKIVIFFFIASYLYIDLAMALFISQYHNSILVRIATYTNILGNTYIYLVPLILIMGISYTYKRWYKLRKPCLYILTTMVCTGIVIMIAKITFGRARPYMLIEHAKYGFYWFKYNAQYWSFPSGHVATAACVCIPLSLLTKKIRLPCYFVILITMISRILTQQHYISDTIISVLIVNVIAYILYQLFFQNKEPAEKSIKIVCSSRFIDIILSRMLLFLNYNLLLLLPFSRKNQMKGKPNNYCDIKR